MIYEKLPFTFDINSLVDAFRRRVRPLPPVMQSAHYGGWSLLSSNGHYTDGWAMGFTCFDEQIEEFNLTKARSIGLLSNDDYVKPTEICEGVFFDLLKHLDNLGFFPRRARICILKANGFSKWHRDALEQDYAVRLHIPLITNPKSRFECEEESAVLPADGSAYLLRVNRMHRVVNAGDQDRIHIVVSVRDTRNLTEFHKERAFRVHEN